MDSDDEYGYFYDDGDEYVENDNDEARNVKDVLTSTSSLKFAPLDSSFLQRLTSDVVLVNILPFICEKKVLSTVAVVSKHFNQMLFSDNAEKLWNLSQLPFQFCIDTYCPACIYKRRQQKGCMHGVLRFLEKCPINNLKLHCFITDIPGTTSFLTLNILSHIFILTIHKLTQCYHHVASTGSLMALSTKRTLRELDLTLSNKSNSPPLEELLSLSNFFTVGGKDENNSAALSFPLLTALTLDSTHLQHVNLAGRARLLDVLGSNLESLSFAGLSPAGVFGILSSRCPKLLKLRVDRVQAAQDILSYKNKSLEELELRRAAFLLYPGK